MISIKGWCSEMQVIPLSLEAELRVLSFSDADAMFELVDSGRYYLREYLPWVDQSRDPYDTAQFIQATIHQRDRNQGIHYGIWFRGHLAGTIGVHSINWANRNTSIGYWLGQPFQGYGLMTASVREYIDKLVFGEWNLNRVQINAAIQNHKSRAIPKRLGFQMEGILRQNEFLYDHYVDHAVYGMLAEDWRRIHARGY